MKRSVICALALFALLTSLIGSAVNIVPAQALASTLPKELPAGVTEQDWAQIQSLLTPTQQAYIKASNPDTSNLGSDEFGWSVSLSGNTLVVGAPGESSNATGVNGDQTNDSASSSGAAYVFTRTSGVWSQQAYLKASNTDAGDEFGYSVAISGDTIVVGARSEASNATGVNGDQADNSLIASGAVYVFTRSGDVWSQQAYLKASNTGGSDFFGWSVAISGDTIVVGAEGESSDATGVNGDPTNNSAYSSGAAYIFVRSGSTWTQQAYLKASNTEAFDSFGHSVAISGDTVVVGANDEDSSATGVDGNETNNSALYSGAAYVFNRNGSFWSQQAYLKASNTEGGATGGDSFGYSVAISGDTIVVGAEGEDSAAIGVNGNQSDNSASNSGAAYVFIRTGSSWSQQAYLKASNTGSNDFFGWSVAISGNAVLIGAEYEDSNATGLNGNQADDSAPFSGSAYLFIRTGGAWQQDSYIKASNTGISDNFGYSVSISGDTIAAGAIGESSNAAGINGDQSNDLMARSGAVYAFSIPVSTTFADVPMSYWAASFIERLYNAGITGGCSTAPLMYCPESTVTRAQMAIFILRGMYGSGYTPPSATGAVFTDVPANHWAAAWIEQLAAEGITGGCGGTTYCPEATVTRAQMAIFLLRGKYGSAYTPPSASGTVFLDVPTSYWASAWIEKLAAEGITSGCGGGLYCPDASVTRAQMAVFLVKAFNLP